MSERISVLVADDNSDFCRLLCERINDAGDMYVIGTAGDGKTAVKMIYELEPDIVLLDIIMPRLDGIGVLERIRKDKPAKMPLMCVITAIGNDIVIRNSLELGADFYIMKPFDIDILITRIRQMHNERYYGVDDGNVISGGSDKSSNHADSVEKVITEVIRNIGITPNLAGYSFLREAVVLAVNQPERLNSISKNIYPEIAKKHGTSARNIDRVIRCAVISAQKKTINAKSANQDTAILINSQNSQNIAQLIRYLTELARKKLASQDTAKHEGMENRKI